MEQRVVLGVVSKRVEDRLADLDQSEGGDDLAEHADRGDGEAKEDGALRRELEASEEDGADEEERARERDEVRVDVPARWDSSARFSAQAAVVSERRLRQSA